LLFTAAYKKGEKEETVSASTHSFLFLYRLSVPFLFSGGEVEHKERRRKKRCGEGSTKAIFIACA